MCYLYLLQCCNVSPTVGKWEKVTCLEDLKERAILETASGGYVFADDTGYFSVGDTRQQG